MKLLEWMCALDNIFVEFIAAGEPKSDAVMKAHAMSKVGRDWEAIATFLGQDEGVTYVQWQAAILEKEREMEETGQIMVQGLAHQLSTNRRNFEGDGGDGAFASTVQQSWRAVPKERTPPYHYIHSGASHRDLQQSIRSRKEPTNVIQESRKEYRQGPTEKPKGLFQWKDSKGICKPRKKSG